MLRRFKEVLDLAYNLQAYPIPKLAEEYDVELTASDMGRVGKLIQSAILRDLSSEPVSDWSEFGVELKAVPVGHTSKRQTPKVWKPAEDTRITAFRLPSDLETPFFESPVFERIRAVMFAPILKLDDQDPLTWFLVSPFIWLPSSDALEAIRQDYERVRQWARDRLERGGSEEEDDLTSLGPRGEPQQLFQKTQYSGDAWAEFEYGGGKWRTRPRSWYLRPSFVQKILKEHVDIRDLRHVDEPSIQPMLSSQQTGDEGS